MIPLTLLVLSILGLSCGEESNTESVTQIEEGLADTELLRAFVVFRHGDRTPEESELLLNSEYDNLDKSIFFPYGTKALTNKGKQRGYRVGQYLRSRYDGLLSKLYLPDEITIRTTNVDRTKMTAQTAMAGLYPPLPVQRWNSELNWQPIPYNTLPYQEDDFLYWFTCPRYKVQRDATYELPEIQDKLKSYQSFFEYLTEKTGNNITIPEHVFYLDNLFQAMENSNVETPQWAQDVMPQIKEMTKIEFGVQFYNSDLTRMASGVLLSEIINATNAAIAGETDQTKVRIYSAHEVNVAALLSALGVFEPHQPNYGATFSVELRKNLTTGSYGITAVYAKDAGGPGEYLTIKGCGEGPLCDYATFISLTKHIVWTKEDFNAGCQI